MDSQGLAPRLATANVMNMGSEGFEPPSSVPKTERISTTLRALRKSAHERALQNRWDCLRDTALLNRSVGSMSKATTATPAASKRNGVHGSPFARTRRIPMITIANANHSIDRRASAAPCGSSGENKGPK